MAGEEDLNSVFYLMPPPLSIPSAVSLTAGAVVHSFDHGEIPALQENQRLFIALSPPPPTRQALARLRNQLAPQVSGHPVSTNNLHLTLAFLGQVPPQRHDELLHLLQKLPLPEGKIVLDTIGAFPKAGVIWAGCSNPNPQMEDLAGQIRGALQACDFAFDNKPFQTHVTLFRKAKPIRLAIEPPITWQLTAPRLYVSISTSDGIEYRVMK